MNKNNFGILASFSWNSKKWCDEATDEDIANSNYDYVKENGWMHEDLNFGYNNFPLEPDGYYIAYTPMFNRLPSLQDSRNVEIVFFRSLNYHINKNEIVGFYAFPRIDKFKREAKHKYFINYDWGNVKAKPEHIVLFKNFIEISNDIATRENYLPIGKKLGQQGYNYLTYQNVLKILDKASALNPKNPKIKSIKFNILTDKKYVSYR